MGSRSLEEIEEIRTTLKKIGEERELNIHEKIISVLNIQKKYNEILERKGKNYCSKHYSDIPFQINRLLELTEYET